MTPSGSAWFGSRPLGLFSKMGVLAGALILALLPVALVAYVMEQHTGVIAATVACMLCLASGLNGLAIAGLFERQLHKSYAGVALGMLIRMGLPLAVILALAVKSHPLLETGFAYYVIAFYQVMLFVDLLLSSNASMKRIHGN